MVKILFNVILNILASMIQIVIFPLNQIIINLLPNLSDKILEVSNSLSALFTGITWGLGVIPPPILITLLFILSVEIARHTIFVSTHIFSLIFDIIRKIKFW